MLPPDPRLITITWIALNLLPLLVVVAVWAAVGGWLWGLCLLGVYVVGVVPYGFFVALPLMVKLFRPPASPYRR